MPFMGEPWPMNNTGIFSVAGRRSLRRLKLRSPAAVPTGMTIISRNSFLFIIINQEKGGSGSVPCTTPSAHTGKGDVICCLLFHKFAVRLYAYDVADHRLGESIPHMKVGTLDFTGELKADGFF